MSTTPSWTHRTGGRWTLAVTCGVALAACQTTGQYAPARAGGPETDGGVDGTPTYRAQLSLERFIVAPRPGSGVGFGTSLGFANDELAIVTKGVTSGSDPTGEDAYIQRFARDGGRWTSVETAKPPGAQDTDRDVPDIASAGLPPSPYHMTFTGAEMFVGYAGYDGQGETGDPLSNSGLVEVFEDTGEGLKLAQQITAPNAGAGDLFGYRTAVSGPWLAVSAVGEDSARSARPDDDSTPDSGAVYMFVRRTNGFRYHSMLKAGSAQPGDLFGSSIALDGDRLIVGAMHESAVTDDATVVPGAGAVYLYRLNTNREQWERETRLQASDAQPDDAFGCALGFSDGRLAIAAWGAKRGPGMPGGRIHILREVDGTWKSDGHPQLEDPSVLFGATVALRGSNLWVGVPTQTSQNGPRSGAVFVLSRIADNWMQTHLVVPRNLETGALFGAALAVSATHVAIAAPGQDVDWAGSDGSNTRLKGAGAVYVYRY